MALISGTNRPDTLTGSTGNHKIYGGGGADAAVLLARLGAGTVLTAADLFVV